MNGVLGVWCRGFWMLFWVWLSGVCKINIESVVIFVMWMIVRKNCVIVLMYGVI